MTAGAVPMTAVLLFIMLALPAGQPVAPTYHVRPGDVLSIQVQGHAELSLDQVIVPPDGTIDVPVVGRVTVVGRTLGEIKSTVTKGLSRELREPLVTVNLVKIAPAQVRIYGAVNQPGAYDLILYGLDEISVSAAIGLAGGYSAQADRSYVTIVRQNREVERIDMGVTKTPVGHPRSGQVMLRPGDTLIVPAVTETVALTGEINTPGRYPLQPDTTLLSLIAEAKGLTPLADPSRVVIIHPDGSQEEVDISGLAEGKLDAAKLPKLHDGDVVLFPRTRNDVIVLGQVNTPGAIDLRPRMTVIDAIALAGGPTTLADLEHVRVVDRDGNERVVKVGTARGEILPPEKLSDESRLRGGEMIIVPEAMHVVSVLGFVRRPGLVTYRPGDRVLDVVARAGGSVPGRAHPENTLLIRPGENPDAPQVIVCDLSAMMRGRKLEENVQVRDGDVIYVPGRFDPIRRRDWILSILQLARTIAIWQR